ncbi:MAG: HAD-IA family hydrolase [Nitratireductor sp.]
MTASIRPTLVLDLDGTLADTRLDLVAVLNRVISSQGLSPLAIDDVGFLAGQGARRMIEHAFALRETELDGMTLDQLFDDFLTDYSATMADNTVLYDGVEAALQRFSQAGWLLAICTNKQEAMARKLVAELGQAHRFSAIAGGDTFPVRKPDPAHLLGTITQAGGNSDRAVMVGDSVTDISAANAARVPVVTVDFGYSDRPIREYSPDYVISHFDQLWQTVQTISANWD